MAWDFMMMQRMQGSMKISLSDQLYKLMGKEERL